MEYREKPNAIAPRIIIHGGAGNITRKSLSPKAYKTYQHALLSILSQANTELHKPDAKALDVATFAVSLLEDDPLFNAGRGAVFTTAGTIEREASVMVSRGQRKRGCGVMRVCKAKSAIKLAREMLVRGDDGNAAQGHVQIAGEEVERLNVLWGLEVVKRPTWFWTRRRWEEHRRGLGLQWDDESWERCRREADEGCGEELEVGVAMCGEREESVTTAEDISWDGKEYLPQGTVGAVVLDSSGVICVATSTGGITNKLPGRIGDTPTLGAGFWAEEWTHVSSRAGCEPTCSLPLLPSWLHNCLPRVSEYTHLQEHNHDYSESVRAVAVGGTGNGDSFLRLNAARTAAAMARYATTPKSRVSLQDAVTAVAGPHGQLERSAEDRWLKSGEGEGGMIGIEVCDGRSEIVFDYNCGGMFHAWIDDVGCHRFEVFQDEKSRG